MGGMGRTFNGSYEEYALIPIKNTFKIQDSTLESLSLEEIISIPETYFTAFGSLYECLDLKSTDTLFIRGSRNEEGIEKLNGLDIDKAIIDDGEIGEKVLKTCPEGVEKILDLIGPSHMKDTMNALKFRGILCVTGILGGVEYIENFDPITDVPNGKYLTGFFSNYPTQKTIDRMFEFIIKNEIKPDIAAVFNDLEDIPKAHMLMESNKAQGKIIFKLDDS